MRGRKPEFDRIIGRTGPQVGVTGDSRTRTGRVPTHRDGNSLSVRPHSNNESRLVLVVSTKLFKSTVRTGTRLTRSWGFPGSSPNESLEAFIRLLKFRELTGPQSGRPRCRILGSSSDTTRVGVPEVRHWVLPFPKDVTQDRCPVIAPSPPYPRPPM